MRGSGLGRVRRRRKGRGGGGQLRVPALSLNVHILFSSVTIHPTLSRVLKLVSQPLSVMSLFT